MLLDFPPQLGNDALAVFEAAFALHVAEGIALDLFVRCLLLEYVDEDLVGRVCAYGVDDGEAEFAFGEVFAEALERGVA